jgi:hypothetical protein
VNESKTLGDELKVTGQQLGDTAKKALRAGNARRLVVRGESGQTYFSLTLTVALILALFFPWLVVFGIVGLIATSASVAIESDGDLGE